MRRQNLSSRRNSFPDSYVVPSAAKGLESLKMEVANEIAFGRETGVSNINAGNYDQALSQLKSEAVQDLGLSDKVQSVGWGNMPARECGAVGGRMGGKIGGNMVKRMIEIAEKSMQ